MWFINTANVESLFQALIFAVLQGKIRSVADPFVSDPLLHHPVIVVLAVFQLSLSLESRPFGMGTNIESSGPIFHILRLDCAN